MKENELTFTEQELLVAESSIKISALEQVLIDKGIITVLELENKIKVISEAIVEAAKKINPDLAKLLEDTASSNKSNN